MDPRDDPIGLNFHIGTMSVFMARNEREQKWLASAEMLRFKRYCVNRLGLDPAMVETIQNRLMYIHTVAKRDTRDVSFYDGRLREQIRTVLTCRVSMFRWARNQDSTEPRFVNCADLLDWLRLTELMLRYITAQEALTEDDGAWLHAAVPGRVGRSHAYLFRLRVTSCDTKASTFREIIDELVRVCPPRELIASPQHAHQDWHGQISPSPAAPAATPEEDTEESQNDNLRVAIEILQDHLGYVTSRQDESKQRKVMTASSMEAHDGDADFCCICKTNRANVAFIPCGHMCICLECLPDVSRNMVNCPKCRKLIDGTLRIYM